jgi:broad specificity phosphatase PhoE
MKRIFFVRHGLSEMNVQGRFSGHLETPLTDRGRNQAAAAGKWARDNGIVFDIVLASPLSRAHDTAKHITAHTGYSHADIVLLDSLKERYYGILEGTLGSESPVPRENRLDNPFVFDGIEGIETITDLQTRAHHVRDYVNALPHETILIVSHGAFGRAFERSVKNMPISERGTDFGNAQIIQLI